MVSSGDAWLFGIVAESEGLWLMINSTCHLGTVLK